MNIENLIGQQELRSRLSGTLEADKLSHAVLLTGPAGSGKKSWGNLLAQAVLCPGKKGIEPCMQCFSCCSFKNGNHSEYHYVEPDKQRIKIEQIRTIRERFYLRGSARVCLIDRAEMMTAEAASSLLKVLEEPPPDLYFILLAEQPRLLLDTILSRCQRYNLKPLKRKEIKYLLAAHKTLPEEEADLLARISAGLPGYAIEMANDEHFAGRYKEAKTLAYNLVYGRDSALQLIAWADLLAEREDLVMFLELVCQLYRDGLIHNPRLRRERFQEDDYSPVWIEGADPAGLEEAVQLINKVIYQINATNVNRRLLMEMMLIMLQRRLMRCP